jgi:hypothetical protein
MSKARAMTVALGACLTALGAGLLTAPECGPEASTPSRDVRSADVRGQETRAQRAETRAQCAETRAQRGIG